MRNRKQSMPSDKSISTNQMSLYSAKFKLPLKYEKRWRINFIYKANKTNMASYDAFGITKLTFIHSNQYKILMFYF